AARAAATLPAIVPAKSSSIVARRARSESTSRLARILGRRDVVAQLPALSAHVGQLVAEQGELLLVGRVLGERERASDPAIERGQVLALCPEILAAVERDAHQLDGASDDPLGGLCREQLAADRPEYALVNQVRRDAQRRSAGLAAPLSAAREGAAADVEGGAAIATAQQRREYVYGSGLRAQSRGVVCRLRGSRRLYVEPDRIGHDLQLGHFDPDHLGRLPLARGASAVDATRTLDRTVLAHSSVETPAKDLASRGVDPCALLRAAARLR